MYNLQKITVPQKLDKKLLGYSSFRGCFFAPFHLCETPVGKGLRIKREKECERPSLCTRLKVAAYGEGTSLSDNPNRYDEKVTLYDKMGNIKNLERRGKADGTNVFGIIDNLTYAYTGNKLTKVTDSATLTTTYYGAFQFVDGANDVTEYTYDANGNLKKDYNKKIVDIQYNSLNLPDGLQFTNGNTTMYTYDAAGNK